MRDYKALEKYEGQFGPVSATISPLIDGDGDVTITTVRVRRGVL